MHSDHWILIECKIKSNCTFMNYEAQTIIAFKPHKMLLSQKMTPNPDV